jgi:DNA-binding beta-propeller fold protein YncE
MSAVFKMQERMFGDNPYLVSLIKRGVSVSTVAATGLGSPTCLFVLADGTLLACVGHSICVLAPSGLLSVLAGRNNRDGEQNGLGADARFNNPDGITVDQAGNMVVVDTDNHALRLVSRAGAVSTLAGGGGEGFADGQGAAARFKWPHSVVVMADGNYAVAEENTVRVVTPTGDVRTLAGNGEAGLADGQGAAARFNGIRGLALDVDGSILVADSENHAVRRVMMDGTVSTVAGWSGEAGYADGDQVIACFNYPSAVVVDKEGTIVVADTENHRLRKIVGRQVTTLAGGSEAGTADGAGVGARFVAPLTLALDERGRLLVTEFGRRDSLRVVEAGLAPPAWMGPLNEKEEERICEKSALSAQKRILDEHIKSDVVVLVRGRSFPLHKAVLISQSGYFKALFGEVCEYESTGRTETEVEIVHSYSDDQIHEVFTMLTKYMYHGDSTVLKCQDVALHEALFVLVDYLDIASLKPYFVGVDETHSEA